MKIASLSPLSSAPLRRKGRSSGAGGSGFASELAADAAEPQTVTGAAAVASVDALLSLQEVSETPLDDERAKRRGEALLEQLDDLRHALLIGALPLIQLERLTRNLAARRGDVADPRLAEVVGEIELRAAVELAKLGR